MLDDLGIDYVEGGYPGANPTDTQLFAEERKLDTTFTAFGMTRRPAARPRTIPGWRRSSMPGPTPSASSPSPGTTTSASRSRPPRGEPRLHPRQRARRQRQGREVLLDCEHFFDGYKANPRLRAGLRQGRLRRGRALGRALRHQRRRAAARGRSDRRRGGEGHPRRPCRHPCP